MKHIKSIFREKKITGTPIQTEGIKSLECVHQPELPAVVDIIFIHGLTGSAFSSWYHEKANLHWPRELLKNDIVNARIFMFDYDAGVTYFLGGTPSQNRLADHASNLNIDLAGFRRITATENRDILFVVHSLGGLIVKRALQLSESSTEGHLNQIANCTRGIIFLGTPHSGSDLAPIAKVLGHALKVTRKRVNTDILGTLKRDSQTLLDVNDGFAKWLRHRAVQTPVNITCFFEELELPVVGKVVSSESARIEGYPSYSIHANHMNMGKFDGREDVGYTRVLGELRRWTEEIGDMQENASRDKHDFLDNLPIADEAAFNPQSNEPLCLQDTREDVLDQVEAWASKDNRQRIFWLCGMAGTGKSTIARSLAARFSQLGRLGASFFFSRGGRDVGDAQKFCTTIAKQLAIGLPSLKQLIQNAIEKERDITKLTKRDQWEIFVKRPLRDAEPVLPSLVIVIDALDECEGDDDIRLILQFMAELASQGPDGIQIRFVLTSRPETPIRLGFRDMDIILHHDLMLHNISRTIVDADISLYFQAEFAKIRSDSEYLDATWPGDEIMDSLVRNAGGLFIYAATVCRFIHAHKEHWPPPRLLQVFLPDQETNDRKNKGNQLPSASPTASLDAAYTCVLKHSVRGVNDQDMPNIVSEFREIVGAIVALFGPLSPVALENLLGVSDGAVYQKIRHLHSVLRAPDKINPTIRLLHPSFRDFLLDKTRCRDSNFAVDEKRIHSNLAAMCITLMRASLRRDICSLRTPGVLTADIEKSRVNQCLPEEVQYACLHWTKHLQTSGELICDDGHVHIFLKEHFLHWLEALGLLGKTAEGILAVASLESLIQYQAQRHPENQDSLTEVQLFIRDARKFSFHSQSIVRKAPLQLYCSALLFAPAMSIVKSQFRNQIPPWFEQLPPVNAHWSYLEQTLEGHHHGATSLAFSPNGRSIVAGSGEGTIRIWQPATGNLLQTLDHSARIASVAFSPNGDKIASGSYDHTVQIWEAVTGKLLRSFEGHSHEVRSVAFSFDGCKIVSGSVDRTVKVWEADTGKLLQTLHHTNTIQSVSFSPDDSKIASGSGDNTIQIWDVASSNVRILEGHDDIVYSIAFSPDGEQLVSGSDDYTVRIWAVATGRLLQTLRGHSRWVLCAAFSPDGQKVVSGSCDHTVRIWKAASGELLRTLRGHSSDISAVAFAPESEGHKVASASFDDTVRIWDLTTGTEYREAGANGLEILADAGSIQCKHHRIATTSYDHTVRIWDPTTAEQLQVLEGHIDRVTDVVFLPGNRDAKIASGGGPEYSIRVWDSYTGEELHVLEGHSGSINEMIGSQDGSRIVSASSDTTVRIWDTDIGTQLQILDGHSGSIFTIAFSPDDLKIISGSTDMTCRIWETTTGKELQILRGHTGWIRSVAFSNDGHRVASGADDRTVRIWDATTGAPLQKFAGHCDKIEKVRFSVTNCEVVSRDYSGRIWRWDASTGGELQSYQGNHSTTGSIVTGCPVFTVDKTRRWILWNDMPIIYIPLDQIPQKFETKNNMFIFSTPSNHITSLIFDINLSGILS